MLLRTQHSYDSDHDPVLLGCLNGYIAFLENLCRTSFVCFE